MLSSNNGCKFLLLLSRHILILLMTVFFSTSFVHNLKYTGMYDKHNTYYTTLRIKEGKNFLSPSLANLCVASRQQIFI